MKSIEVIDDKPILMAHLEKVTTFPAISSFLWSKNADGFVTSVSDLHAEIMEKVSNAVK